MEQRYDKPFLITALNETNLSGYYEGRGISVDEEVTFNFAKRSGRDPQTDYPLNVWAKSLISPLLESSDVRYEAVYQSPSLSFNDSLGLEYWDDNFVRHPEKLSVQLSFLYTGIMTRERVFSIINKMKEQGAGSLSIMLYPIASSPDLSSLNKLGFAEYYAENREAFTGACEILTPDELTDLTRFEIGNPCLKDY
ncbi:hypothetical protein [Paenibacillus camerounensis]|uniref:hypothetical protein n=1 Tax=Paenibacillus camerounensis TaxID=1243663 RepID=UPI0012F750FF|nr:hypothetical protein [Paenibacillus camerounensis]